MLRKKLPNINLQKPLYIQEILDQEQPEIVVLFVHNTPVIFSCCLVRLRRFKSWIPRFL